jgi:hypothetical protein
LIELVQELETYNWQMIYSLEAFPHSVSSQERTSAMQWTGMMHLARKNGITVDIQVLRFIRATLLFESMAVRLLREINFVDQYQVFKNHRAEEARRRVTKALMNQMDGKNNEQTIIRIDRIAHTAQGLLFRASHMVSMPSVNFNALMSKWSYAVYDFMLFLVQMTALTLVFGFFINLNFYLSSEHSMSVQHVFQMVLSNPIFQVIFFILIFIHGRKVLFRFDDKEV